MVMDPDDDVEVIYEAIELREARVLVRFDGELLHWRGEGNLHCERRAGNARDGGRGQLFCSIIVSFVRMVRVLQLQARCLRRRVS